MLRVPRIRTDLSVAPAMVMAFGNFLLFAGTLLLSRRALWWLASLLLLWAGCLGGMFIGQAREDARVLWDYTTDHFGIGAWVAAVNILAVVVHRDLALTALARAANLAGWALWALYMCWIWRMARQPEHRKVNGRAFLTTVATQSAVISTAELWPGASAALTPLLILGLAFYCAYFYRIWIVGGIAAQLGDWAPQNNITHGALSITVLAAEFLELPPAIIDALWIAAALLFLFILVAELRMGARLLRFQMSNYTRNFTYGMFFACTYYGVTNFPGSLIAKIAHSSILPLFAGLVAAMNIWELAHQIAIALRPSRGRPQPAFSPDGVFHE